MSTDSKFNTKAAMTIAAQLYLAKGLKKNPARMIKFIMSNREYYPNISDEMLGQIKNEHGIKDEDLEKIPQGEKFTEMFGNFTKFQKN